MDAVRGAAAPVAVQPIAPSAGASAAGASAPVASPSGGGQRTEASHESTQDLVARANMVAQASQLQVRFTVSNDNKPQITMFSPIDGSVIRQIPDMKLRDMMAQVKDTLGGMMVDQLA